MNDVVSTDRNELGQFVPGTSGNPKGRPKGAKHKITDLKQRLEIAVRENMNAQDVIDIVNAMVKEAKAGSVGAAKLIMDKVISNAKVDDDVQDSSQPWVFHITNATISHNTPPEEAKVIKTIDPQEDTNEHRS